LSPAIRKQNKEFKNHKFSGIKMKIIKTILILSLLFVCSSLYAQKKNKEFSNRGIANGSFVSLGPKEASIYDITAHPTQKNIMYLITDYYEKDNSNRGYDSYSFQIALYETTDNGETWNFLTYFPHIVWYADELYYEIDPNNSNSVYFGGDFNVMLSSDGETNWEIFQQGMSSKVTRNGLIIEENNNILYAATKNQGILALDLNAATKIKRDGNKPVSSFQLFGTYPNPFNQQTVIRFQVSGVRFQGLGVREQVLGGARVSLQIYNILGQLITTLVDEEKQPGEYRVVWNGKDMNGYDVPSGLYFYRMHAGDFTDVKKMILLR